MRTTNRRRNRLRSAQYPTERWKPPLMFVVLAVGVAFGLALGLSNRLSKPPANVQEHYMLLVSDLYAQGVPLATVRDRLVSLGYSNPSVAVLAVADQLAHSSDRVSQQEADQLHNFAEALVAGPDSPALAQSTAQAAAVTTPAAPPSSTPAAAVVLPTSTVTAVPTGQPTATNETPTSSQANSQVSVPPAPPTATAAPPAPPKATAAPARAGVVRTAGHQPALLRADPTAKSAAVVVIPDGAKVQVYGTANGEAVDPGDRRWYHVVYSGHGGYLYNKLVQVGG
ncbi:MAG: SH3 domain-containing protein [Chloroflexota bacterium]